MKKLFFVFAAAAIVAICSSSSRSASADARTAADPAAEILANEAEAPATIIKNYKVSNFKGIQAQSVFDVTVRRSSKYSLEIEISKEYEDYLDIKVVNGTLRLGFKNINSARRLFAHMDKCIAVATVTLPELEGVYLSGASKLSSDDVFDLRGRDFRLDVSGASKLYNLNINGGDARITISGASKVYLCGKFEDVDIDLSGASGFEFEADTEDLDIDTSGSSTATIFGNFEDVEASCSGASGINISGSADSLDIDCSGASGVNAVKLQADDVAVDLSGASYAKVNVLKSLDVECSGASSCTYKAEGKIDLNIREVSRSATLKKL